MERFGSSVSGLGLSHCDLDIHISLGDSHGNQEIAKNCVRRENKLQIRKIEKLLRYHKSERFRSAQSVVHAKTPIVRLKDRITGIWCDLNSGNRLGRLVLVLG